MVSAVKYNKCKLVYFETLDEDEYNDTPPPLDLPPGNFYTGTIPGFFLQWEYNKFYKLIVLSIKFIGVHVHESVGWFYDA